jgi:iron-sulfur cluster assembly enzyme ISCU, mitochondrial
MLASTAVADFSRLQSRSSMVQCCHLQVDEEGNIVDAKFKTFGCGSAIASSSVATEWVKGKSIDEALSIRNSDIAKHLSLPPVKLHCSMLAEDAIKAAVKDIKERRAKSVE